MSTPFIAPLQHSLVPEPQQIEITSCFQIPAFHIVGLPSPEVSEAKERVRSAIEASGYSFPRRRIVINLSPAYLKKAGTGLDLPMALAVLSHSQPETTKSQVIAWGEVGLQGELRSAGGVARALFLAFQEQIPMVVLPIEDQEEVKNNWPLILSKFQGIDFEPEVHLVTTLKEAWESYIYGDARTLWKYPKAEPSTNDSEKSPSSHLLPLSRRLERTLICSLAGRHHLLLLGPKGTGKSRLSEWLETLFAGPDSSEQLTHALLSELSLLQGNHSAFRRVGTNVKSQALIGAIHGNRIIPGEYALAHGGVLVADELCEWPRDARESLRLPLEDEQVILRRAQGAAVFPARFLFFGTANLCPCGEFDGTNEQGKCECKPHQRENYLKRLSGPVLDRIDLVTQVTSDFRTDGIVNGSGKVEELKERIKTIQKLAQARLGDLPGQLEAARIEELITKDPLKPDFERLTASFSLRSRHKIYRVALTLGLLDGVPYPGIHHWQEAACYRADRWLKT